MTSALQDFEGFYRATYASAYRTALGIVGSASLAEDVTQDAFVDAYRRRGSFRGDGPVEAWLQRIVVNRAIDELRRHRRRNEVCYELDIEPGESTYGRIDTVELLDAIAALDVRQRAAIVLRYFHGYPMRTVGATLGTTEGGASMLVRRAMERLRSNVTDSARKAPPGEAETAARGR